MEVVGHRGALLKAPENTVESFLAAIQAGATMIEFDIRILAAGEIILLHDETLDRTTNGSGSVYEADLETLKSLDAGSWFSDSFSDIRIPLFEEVLDFLRGKAKAMIEIKGRIPPDSEFEKKIISALSDAKMMGNSEVISFNHSIVKNIKNICPEITTGIIYSGEPVEPLADAVLAEADYIHPISTGSIDSDLVRKCRRYGIGICATTDDPNAMKRLKELGVQAVCTNKPEILAEIAAEKEIEHHES